MQSTLIRVVSATMLIGSVAVAQSRPGTPAPKTTPKPASRPATAPATRPVRLNADVARVVDRLSEQFAKEPTVIDASTAGKVVRILLDHGDLTTATKFFGLPRLVGDKDRYAGIIATNLPGGITGAEGRAFLARYNTKPSTLGGIEGITLGYARRGEIPKALAEIRRMNDRSFERSTLRVLVQEVPDRRITEAFEKSLTGPLLEFETGPLLYALLVTDQQAKADALMTEIRAAAGKPEKAPGAKVSIDGKPPEEVIFEPLFCALLSRGDISAALTMEKERFDHETEAALTAKDPGAEKDSAKDHRVRAYAAIATARAYQGDVAAIRTAMAEVETFGGAEWLSVPLAYALASKDAAGLAAFIKDPSKATLNSQLVEAAAFGAAAAGRFDAGDTAGARKIVDAALAKIDGIKQPAERAGAMVYLLGGLTYGPEALRSISVRLSSYPVSRPALKK